MARALLLLSLLCVPVAHAGDPKRPDNVATFSIVAADPESGEVGVAVASRFFAVGTAVPYVRAGVGAVATQANVNGLYGTHGLELLAQGLPPEQVVQRLTKEDADPSARQLGMVSAKGESATYTGPAANAWAGGRHGPNYAVQGNILTGADVVEAMEKAFLGTKGDLAARMLAAVEAGDAKGGDSRGRQSAALVVARPHGGFGGYTDRYIDVRVDDHPRPLVELRRLVGIGRVNGLWNMAWTAHTQKRPADALPLIERTAKEAETGAKSILPEVRYDLAVIRTSAGKKAEALQALQLAVKGNPKLAHQARGDPDLEALRQEPGFERAIKR
ncbi:DUF1028 domain-containing protein [Aggregicoccus sp. 17bor-14]|uniref:DUF1028 domain-containing protein n=1 Tax=Myxococcaceae TaxID=31 RepID=UPI00129D170D|nr:MULTISPECIES: DUF1028 domain-containing protein [Myxococcaceae]MBF5045018.1 DUF1028 domain-containing protein [Simulacricoccus sp. 17bor-14]MRI90761.1 DUF1028 domain-containing protein [Aggregicoccus sp. 17bor-14]